MNRYGRGMLSGFYLILLLLISSLFAKNQVLFYSQAPLLADENLKLYVKSLGPQHRFLSLNGTYDLFGGANEQSIGRVSIPSVFYSRQDFIFRKTFQMEKVVNAHYRLHFEGLNGLSEVRLNDKLLFSGSRNFLPLSLDVPASYLESRNNTIEIKIRSWKGRDAQFPTWMPVNLPRIDNGINRSVFIEIAPAVCLRQPTAHAGFRGDSLMISGSLRIQSIADFKGDYNIVFQILEKGKVWRSVPYYFETDSTQNTKDINYSFTVPGLEPWSPQAPHVYRLKIVLKHNNKEVDTNYLPLSVRQVQADHQNIRLNGNPVKLDGINYIYQDARGVDLLNRRQVLQDLEKIKSLGFNAIRVGFYPRSPLFYSLTDSLGLVCFQDLPFPMMDSGFLADSLKQDAAVKYVRSFLDLVSGHPSVLGIGLSGFYDPDNLEGKMFLEKLSDLISQENLQLVYSGTFLPEPKAPDFADLCCFEILDRNHQKTYLDKIMNQLPGQKPVIFSAISKAISYRVDSSAITHDLQQITELYSRINSSEWKSRLAGDFVLTYSDYYLETPSLQAGPQNKFLLNTVGIYDLDRNLKKDAAALLASKKRMMPAAQFASEKKNIGTFLFVIVGLINFLVFVVLYRSMIEFRHNVHRSIRRPHGFFTDIQERRLIPYTENLILLLILSVNGAVMTGSILYFFRNNFYMDYLLSLVFPGNGMKLLISYIIWRPFLLLPILTFVIIATFFLMAVPIRFVSFFREPKIHSRQAIAISIWAAAPFLISLPVAMFFYNLLLVLNSYWILFVLLLYFHVWYLLRWINGTRVMTEVSFARVFLFTIAFLGIIGGGFYYYLQTQVNLSAHLVFLLHLYQSLI
ncbi:MAG: glycoside hydrolase family 2 TIM barrel-domain containing protein [Calditrichia bacterium]